MNLSICSKCKKTVPVDHKQENGKEYLVKKCPECGETTELVSNDSSQYNRKRDAMSGEDYPGCSMNCLQCTHRLPNIVFIETTNRCNMNCPICITNVPSMGFEFEPKMEYFEKIFKHYSQFEFPPSIQLFGGEPTMRDDIFDVINLAKSYELSVRLVTNGLKMADEAYCEKVMSSGAAVLISFDGLKREMYEALRASGSYLDIKTKALENISKRKSGKVVLMTVMDKNMNGEDMPLFLDYCLKHPRTVRGIFLMPLAHVWSENRLDYKPERTTPEDVEKIVDDSVEGDVEFIPLGAMNFKNLARIFKIKNMPFVGVHPNCESFTLLMSNGEKYISFNTYLKYDALSWVNDIRKVDGKGKRYLEKPTGAWGKALLSLSVAGIFIKHANMGAIVGAKGFQAFWKWMRFFGSLLTGKKFKDVLKEQTRIKGILQVLLLPFEDDCTIESERLEKCSSCFAYIDTATDSIRNIPFCIWEKYKNVIMKDMAIAYNKDGYTKGLEGETIKTGQVVDNA
ncbi:MAG: radical SAM protein [Candidatus Tantalella remota]|nr:radical SAM protein [Candidatus Tantalella remota]